VFLVAKSWLTANRQLGPVKTDRTPLVRLAARQIEYKVRACLLFRVYTFCGTSVVLRQSSMLGWAMRFTRPKTEPTAPSSAERLEQVREQRRAAKAAYDTDFRELTNYYAVHPPPRRPFLVDDKYYYQPVNTLASVSEEQRRLELKVVRSRELWTELQKREAELEFALKSKR